MAQNDIADNEIERMEYHSLREEKQRWRLGERRRRVGGWGRGIKIWYGNYYMVLLWYRLYSYSCVIFITCFARWGRKIWIWVESITITIRATAMAIFMTMTILSCRTHFLNKTCPSKWNNNKILRNMSRQLWTFFPNGNGMVLLYQRVQFFCRPTHANTSIL